ncbi:uncharacterized protein BJX67DRAFT_13895 [Aspergillus lucknowensis]|uniref:Secreted protein n=1 Tax=Aspergillus lucknowensis TaxID=176173 RepID=A0ABR4M7W3_9EURO
MLMKWHSIKACSYQCRCCYNCCCCRLPAVTTTSLQACPPQATQAAVSSDNVIHSRRIPASRKFDLHSPHLVLLSKDHARERGDFSSNERGRAYGSRSFIRMKGIMDKVTPRFLLQRLQLLLMRFRLHTRAWTPEHNAQSIAFLRPPPRAPYSTL